MQRRGLSVLDGPLDEFAWKKLSFWTATNKEFFKNVGIGGAITLAISGAIGAIQRLSGGDSASANSTEAAPADLSESPEYAASIEPSAASSTTAKRSVPEQGPADGIDDLQNALIQLYYTNPEIFDEESTS